MIMAPPLIPAHWQLPDYFRGRLGTAIGRQRMMQHGEQLLLVAHEVPAADEVTRRGVLFWYDGQQWLASTGQPGKIAIANLIQSYAKRIDAFDQQEAQAQRALDYLPLLDGLAPLMRSARNFYEVLQEARKAAPQLREFIDFRDQMYELSRTAELLYQDARNSMDVAVVRRAEEQAEASHKMTVAAHRLNSMAALFFPLATLGAVFGTTLTDNWSWSRSIGPFVGFVLLGLLSGLLLAIFVRRTSK
jgi:hypothetical protein